MNTMFHLARVTINPKTGDWIFNVVFHEAVTIMAGDEIRLIITDDEMLPVRENVERGVYETELWIETQEQENHRG